jgi:phenylpropionate dioxygenase-like ring-hydroxylating dioxygenase large terminal subunit
VEQARVTREDWAESSRRRWEVRYPELGTEPLSIEPYVSKEYFALECDRLFRHVWINVGREEEIPQPGDFFVKDISPTRSSILVARGKDGVVRASHNMCSHRGNKLVYDGRGHCDRFLCKFHGWSYGLDGRLLNVTDESQFCDLNKRELGLTPIATDTWEGFIFINLDPKPRESLTEYLGTLGEGLVGYPFAEKTACFAYQVEVKCNWKVFMNAFQEAYHLPFVHGQSVWRASRGGGNPLSRALDITLFPLHQTLSIYSNPSPDLNPVDQLVTRYGVSHSKRVVPIANLPPGLNRAGHPNWGFDLEVVFPNTMLLIFRIGIYIAYNFWPIDADRTLWDARMYNSPPRNAAQRFVLEWNRVNSYTALREDLSTLEAQQSALNSRAKSHVILQDNEIMIRHHYKTVDRFVRQSVE